MVHVSLFCLVCKPHAVPKCLFSHQCQALPVSAAFARTGLPKLAAPKYFCFHTARGDGNWFLKMENTELLTRL